MTDKSPHPDDIACGRRLRVLRQQRGVSQTTLAEALGITFQQVQKYERGINRISFSKLLAASRFLGVEISTFVEEEPATRPLAPAAAKAESWLKTPEAYALSRDLAEVSDSVRLMALRMLHAAVQAAPVEESRRHAA